MGNFSRDTFDKLKHYVGVRLQQGVPLVDADWNEQEDIRKYELQAFLKWFVGNGVPRGNDGFRILPVTDGTGNDFIIKGGDGTPEGAGRCLVEGWDAINESDLKYSAQPLFENETLAEKWGVEPVNKLDPPAEGEEERTDTVYLDIWEREVDADEDGNLVNSAIGIKTCVRLKREWVVRVAQGKSETELDAPPEGHVFYPLATLDRVCEGAIEEGYITDRRRTGMAVLSKEITIKDGNVGIGTTEPLSKLDVYHGDLHVGAKFPDKDTSSRFIRVETMTPGEPSLVLSRGGNWAAKLLVTETSFRIRDFAGHMDRKDLVTILNTGKVGIGLDATKEHPQGRLTLRGIVEPAQGLLTFFSDTADMEYDGGGDGLFIFKNTATKGKTAFIGGNVGIGTASPNAKLHVQSDDDNDNAQVNIWSTGATRDAVLMFGTAKGGENFYLTLDEDDGRKFKMGTGIADNKLVIQQDGNVGIGMSPEEKLDVNGNLRINGDFKFPNTGGGFAVLTNQTFFNERDFQDNNIKFQLDVFHIPHKILPPSEFIVGHRSDVFGVPCFAKRFSINQAGDLYCAGSKDGYVVDHFVNRVGDTLEQGDVVVISKYQVSYYSGDQNNIPIPEVDLTDRAYDSHVCGIVSKVVTEKDLPYVEVEPEAQAEPKNSKEKKTEIVVPYKHPLQEFTAKFSEKLDYTKVQDKQMGKMVTLGAFAHCKVDADIAPIEVGDLLTTSPTKGHAQKVLEPEKAVGAIIGKALGSLKNGKGKIPVLVMLQ